MILCAGAGVYAVARIMETEGVYLPPENRSPEAVLAKLPQLLSSNTNSEIATGPAQTLKFVSQAAEAAGIALNDTSWGPKS
jgi:hypothetical protein